MVPADAYNTRLGAGLGLIDETRILLELWNDKMSVPDLVSVARESGQFSVVSARRLRNLIVEGFATRYLTAAGAPAKLLKQILSEDQSTVFQQLCFVFTCRAHRILADFVTAMYWPAYAAGKDMISNEESLIFIRRVNNEGFTTTPWSESIQRRVASYLTGCCADFGLLEAGMKKVRRLLPFRIDARTAAVLAYERHFAGLSDNAVITDESWGWFGCDRQEVMSELERWARRNLFIIQSGADFVKIDWRCKTMREVLHGIR